MSPASKVSGAAQSAQSAAVQKKGSKKAGSAMAKAPERSKQAAKAAAPEMGKGRKMQTKA